MIPFHAEPMEALRARLPAALAPVYTEEPEQPRAGQDRRHVFDFEDGLRLIVSREYHTDDDQVYLHVSAIFVPDSAMARWLRKVVQTQGPHQAKAALVRRVEERFAALSDDRPITLQCMTPSEGIPHWLGPGELGAPHEETTHDR